MDHLRGSFTWIVILYLKRNYQHYDNTCFKNNIPNYIFFTISL